MPSAPLAAFSSFLFPPPLHVLHRVRLGPHPGHTTSENLQLNNLLAYEMN